MLSAGDWIALLGVAVALAIWAADRRWGYTSLYFSRRAIVDELRLHSLGLEKALAALNRKAQVLVRVSKWIAIAFAIVAIPLALVLPFPFLPLPVLIPLVVLAWFAAFFDSWGAANMTWGQPRGSLGDPPYDERKYWFGPDALNAATMYQIPQIGLAAWVGIVELVLATTSLAGYRQSGIDGVFSADNIILYVLLFGLTYAVVRIFIYSIISIEGITFQRWRIEKSEALWVRLRTKGAADSIPRRGPSKLMSLDGKCLVHHSPFESEYFDWGDIAGFTVVSAPVSAA